MATSSVKVAAVAVVGLVVCALAAGGGYLIGAKAITWTYPSNRWIEKYQDDINRLDTLITVDNATYAYDFMTELIDRFGGPRTTGSASLDATMDWLAGKLSSDGDFDAVHSPIASEQHPLIHWRNASAYVVLQHPHQKPIDISRYALVASMADNQTYSGDFSTTASVSVVKSADELSSANGTIVVLDHSSTKYSDIATYQRYGTLLENVTPPPKALLIGCDTSLHSLSEGFIATSAFVPFGCISMEDVQLLARSQDRGERPVLRIDFSGTASNFTGDLAHSSNIVVDIAGSTGDEMVLLTAFVDSWQPANTDAYVDDGAGVAVVVNAMRALKRLGIYGVKPKRTIRAVFLTAEGNGAWGAIDYARVLRNLAGKPSKVVYAVESRRGQMKPLSKETPIMYYYNRGSAKTDLVMDIASSLPEDMRVQPQALSNGGIGPGDTDWFNATLSLAYDAASATRTPDTTASNAQEYLNAFTSDDLQYTSRIYAIYAYLLANS